MSKIFLKISLLFSVLLISGCGGSLPADLEYGNFNKGQFLAADVNPAGSSERIMWFSLHDRKGDAHSAAFYRNAPDLVAGNPARVGQPGGASGVQDGSIWVLVAGRFEIRLFTDESASTTVSLDQLSRFIETFDLRSMASYEGAQLDGTGLARFTPALPGRD